VQFASESRNSRRAEVVIDITSLVDIVFQLVIFFVLTTTFVSNPGIEVDLPRAKSHEIQHKTEEVVVALTADGKIILHGKSINLEQLADIFDATAAQSKATMVILQADQDVAHGRVVEVMDLAKAKGLEKLAIATQAEQ